MATRKIVKIDEERCNGCGLCVPSCAEGAIQIIDGKARLAADNLCDGLGACLGECPMDAITIEDRDAEAFDEKAVEQHLGRSDGFKAEPKRPVAHAPTMAHGHGGGCPGARMLQFERPAAKPASATAQQAPASALRQWPVQLHLVPPTAPFFHKAHVVLAADCVAFAMGGFHERYLEGRSLAIACPKLDQGQEVYLDKLVAMIDQAKIETMTVMIMEVPCCSGLLRLAQSAVAKASRKVPLKLVRVGLQGDILDEAWV
ncbi:MAG: 4Fe-4S binding protein [Myxococcota bacterium]|jgi:NAD-dependent dihydropyrimidine dehydrogenase PreA subunit|nr:4Fe-4S binding protein [Myxococcota bacterium]